MTYRTQTLPLILSASLRSLGSLAIPALVAGAVTLLNPSVVEAAVSEATCRIHAVEARQDGDGTIPADLAFLADQLQAPELSLIGGELDKLELHTNLKRGSKSLVDVNFVVGSNQIMLIPVRRGDQAIIFAYQCKS
jgi:hypothetical protein